MIVYEDEELELTNSPLSQYFNDINFIDSKNNNDNSSDIKSKTSYEFKWVIFERIYNIIYRIKKYFFMPKLNILLNQSLNMHILDEEDEIFLQYWINTKNIHLNDIPEKLHFNSKVTMMSFMVLIFCSLLLLDSVATVCLIVFLFLSWLTFLLLYSFIIKHLFLQFFDQMTIITKQSRQIIILIQELLSINQGYARAVYGKDDENYDSNKSFNVKFLQEIIKKVYFLLSDMLNESQRLNDAIQKLCTHDVFCPDEVSWLKEKCNFSSVDEFQEEFDVNKPMSALKVLHNLIQSQFIFSIKRIILWSLSFNLHPSFTVVRLFFPYLSQYTHISAKFNKYLKLIQYKTKSNVKNDHSTKSFGQYSKKQLIISSIQSLELHLFEISEFLSHFLLELEEKKSDCNIFENQKTKLEKCNFHIESLYNAWFTLYNEGRSSMNEENCVSFKSEGHPIHLDYDENHNKTNVLIDDEREIVDEVLEGVPLDIEDDRRMINSYNELDTFVEKSKRNSNLLLKELKSVIELRAEDWKKREKIALERRAAEGKFVFGEENIPASFSKPVSIDSVNDVGIKYSGSDDVNESLDLNCMKSFSDMIVKQRKTMFLESNWNLNEEECFCD